MSMYPENVTVSSNMSRRNFIKGISAMVAISGLGLASNLAFADEAEESVVGQLEDGGYYLFDVCTPYQSSNMGYDKTFQMAGDEYTRGLEGDGYLYFNLKGLYDRLTCVFGHIDGLRMSNTTFTFEGDGETIATFEVEATSMPYKAEISLTGITQFVIKSTANYCAMAEIVVYPSGSSVSSGDSSSASASQLSVVPDGTYPIAVDEAGSTVTVTITVVDNCVTGLEIESVSGGASPSAILAAFEQLIRTQGVAVESEVEDGTEENVEDA